MIKILTSDEANTLRTPTPDMVLLTTGEAATLVKLSKAWFERERWRGTGPAFIKVGRSIRYEKAELLSWFAEHRVVPRVVWSPDSR